MRIVEFASGSTLKYFDPGEKVKIESEVGQQTLPFTGTILPVKRENGWPIGEQVQLDGGPVMWFYSFELNLIGE